MPLKFLRECVATAVYLLNRLPSAILQYKSSFEILHSHPPNLGHLRTFDCLAYTSNPNITDKMSPKAISSALMGYSSTQKSYKEITTNPKWIEAMKLEIAALEENNTWSIVDLLKEKTLIGYKWVFKVKYKSSGEVERSNRGIHICQRKYSFELISEIGLGGANIAGTPLECNQKLTSIEYDRTFNKGAGHEDPILNDAREYQRLVGRLLYLTMTRPDISFGVQRLNICRHSVTLIEALVCRPEDLSQVILSSAEAEFRSMASCVAEVTWLIGLFRELGIELHQHVDLFCNSKVAIQ
nr:uncharacterized protein LOC104086239 [Nicotiana tomentosiformis]